MTHRPTPAVWAKNQLRQRLHGNRSDYEDLLSLILFKILELFLIVLNFNSFLFLSLEFGLLALPSASRSLFGSIGMYR
jgi:hypothetical protein